MGDMGDDWAEMGAGPGLEREEQGVEDNKGNRRLNWVLWGGGSWSHDLPSQQGNSLTMQRQCRLCARCAGMQAPNLTRVLWKGTFGFFLSKGIKTREISNEKA